MWDEFLKIIVSVVVAAGGIGGVVILIIKFAANNIADKLSQKYQLKLNKELEKCKSDFDKKTYISKAVFDIEISTYRKLSKTFSDMVNHVNVMIPATCVIESYADENKQREYEIDLYSKSQTAVVCAQNALNANVAFIPAHFVESYSEILKLCKVQLGVFERRWATFGQYHNETSRSDTDCKKTAKINDLFNELNNNIRSYLTQLDVLD